MDQPGLQQAYELSILSLIAAAVAVMMGAVSSIQTRAAKPSRTCTGKLA